MRKLAVFVNLVCRICKIEKYRPKQRFSLELMAIDLLKNQKKYEINLIFKNNSYITLSTEIIEATLEDQNKV